MVERITAYRLNDGRIFSTKWDAVQYETQRELTDFLIKHGLNEAQAQKLGNVSGELALILEPLAREIRKDRKERSS